MGLLVSLGARIHLILLWSGTEKAGCASPLRVDQYLHTTANASIRNYQFVLEESFVAFLISGVQLVGRNGVDVYGEYSSRAQMTAVS